MSPCSATTDKLRYSMTNVQTIGFVLVRHCAGRWVGRFPLHTGTFLLRQDSGWRQLETSSARVRTKLGRRSREQQRVTQPWHISNEIHPKGLNPWRGMLKPQEADRGKHGAYAYVK